MSFREIAITVRAVNRASHEFARIQTDAEALSTRIRSLGSAIAGLGAAGTAIAHMAHQFGLLNAEQTRLLSGAMQVIAAIGMFMRTSWGAAIAQKVYAAACWVATTAQNALNISYATFLALTGVGVAAIIAAAAAVAYFASQMNAATASVREYNEAAAEVSTRTRSIVRAGELELYRRGVER
jgi:4-amino-4-deoxy-L-arabinose transferase-like glycosyltransferase